jgi:hypothetical protein
MKQSPYANRSIKILVTHAVARHSALTLAGQLRKLPECHVLKSLEEDFQEDADMEAEGGKNRGRSSWPEIHIRPYKSQNQKFRSELAPSMKCG